MKAYRNLVNGKYVDAADGRTIPVINPSTEEQYATAPLSASADVDQAMQVAADAFETWRDSTPKDRSLALFRIAEQAGLAAVAGFALQLPRWPGKLVQSLTLFDRQYRTDTHVVAALGTDRLEGVRLSQRGKVVELACDRLACGFGLIPNIQLGQALGCAVTGAALAVDAWQATTLGRLKAGDPVNLEIDVLARYLDRMQSLRSK